MRLGFVLRVAPTHDFVQANRHFMFHLPQSSWPIRALLATGLLALLVTGFAAIQIRASATPPFHGTAYPDAPFAPDFELIDHRGESRSLSDFRGEIVLLFFGFTRCPDVCPLALSRLARVLAEAEIGADRASVLLVTVDPEYDTAERLAEFVTPFGPAFTGLRGDSTTTRAIMADYGVFAQPAHNHEGAPTLAHTSLVFGIDRSGRLTVLIHPEEPAEIVASDIRALLQIRP